MEESKRKQLEIIEYPEPPGKIPKFDVDNKLDPKLDECPLLSHLNIYHCMLLCGRPRSGKTSFICKHISEGGLFNKVFEKVYVFMPQGSRSAMEDCIWDTLPENQVFETLDAETLGDLYVKIQRNAAYGMSSLVVFDDVQRFLKGPCQEILLHMVNNRRASRLCVWIAAQTYKKIPPDVRSSASDLVLFNLSRRDYEFFEEEHVMIDDDDWEAILTKCLERKDIDTDHATGRQIKKHFLYANSYDQAYFLDYDKVVLPPISQSSMNRRLVKRSQKKKVTNKKQKALNFLDEQDGKNESGK